MPEPRIPQDILQLHPVQKCGVISSHQLGVSTNGGTPKWMVHDGNSIYKMDDLRVPLLQETTTYKSQLCPGELAAFTNHSPTIHSRCVRQPGRCKSPSPRTDAPVLCFGSARSRPRMSSWRDPPVFPQYLQFMYHFTVAMYKKFANGDFLLSILLYWSYCYTNFQPIVQYHNHHLFTIFQWWFEKQLCQLHLGRAGNLLPSAVAHGEGLALHPGRQRRTMWKTPRNDGIFGRIWMGELWDSYGIAMG